jgi:hypothetical protein
MTEMQLTMNGQPAPVGQAGGAYGRAQAVTLSPTGQIAAAQGQALADGPLTGGMGTALACSGELPDGPVAAGAAWTATETSPGAGPTAVPLTLLGFVHRGGHTIGQIRAAFRSIVVPASGGAPIAGVMTGTGASEFDTDLGRPLASEVQVHLVGTMAVPTTGPTPAKGHVDMNIDLKSAPVGASD